MTDIYLVRTQECDWEGLYINNELVAEAHSLDAGEIVSLVTEALRGDGGATLWLNSKYDQSKFPKYITQFQEEHFLQEG